MIQNGEIDRQTVFEKTIKPKLMYVGFLGAVLMCIAYIAVVLVLIFGFQVKSITQSLIFAVVNGIVGFIIMQFLKIQGIDFAKSLDENKTIMKKYDSLKLKSEKKKKVHSLKHYWFTSVTKDIIMKFLGIVIFSGGLIYIVIEGSQDYCLLLLAFVNLLMFICFGLLSLCNSYEFYNTSYIPYIEDKIDELQQIQVSNKVCKVVQSSAITVNTGEESSDRVNIPEKVEQEENTEIISTNVLQENKENNA